MLSRFISKPKQKPRADQPKTCSISLTALADPTPVSLPAGPAKSRDPDLASRLESQESMVKILPSETDRGRPDDVPATSTLSDVKINDSAVIKPSLEDTVGLMSRKQPSTSDLVNFASREGKASGVETGAGREIPVAETAVILEEHSQEVRASELESPTPGRKVTEPAAEKQEEQKEKIEEEIESVKQPEVQTCDALSPAREDPEESQSKVYASYEDFLESIGPAPVQIQTEGEEPERKSAETAQKAKEEEDIKNKAIALEKSRMEAREMQRQQEIEKIKRKAKEKELLLLRHEAATDIQKNFRRFLAQSRWKVRRADALKEKAEESEREKKLREIRGKAAKQRIVRAIWNFVERKRKEKEELMRKYLDHCATLIQKYVRGRRIRAKYGADIRARTRLSRRRKALLIGWKTRRVLNCKKMRDARKRLLGLDPKDPQAGRRQAAAEFIGLFRRLFRSGRWPDPVFSAHVTISCRRTRRRAWLLGLKMCPSQRGRRPLAAKTSRAPTSPPLGQRRPCRSRSKSNSTYRRSSGRSRKPNRCQKRGRSNREGTTWRRRWRKNRRPLPRRNLHPSRRRIGPRRRRPS